MIKKVCSLILIAIVTFSISSCKLFDVQSSYEFIEYGDYIYALSKPTYNNKSVTYLYGLTELGKQKKYLVLPSEYENKIVDYFGILCPTFMPGYRFKDDFSSDILEKVYIDFPLKGNDINNSPSENDDKMAYTFVLWYIYDYFGIRHYKNRIKDVVIGNNIFFEYFLDNSIEGINNSNTKSYIGNVSYIYNYDSAPNDGYYWVDNYDNSLIEYIPPEPTRQGYKFDGWYKEEDCTNKWDFNSDKTSSSYMYYEVPNEISTDEYKKFYSEYISTHMYVETKLYAKWVKI